MYKTIEMYLQNNSVDSFITYDFKNECIWTEVTSAQSPIEKFRIYRLKNKSSNAKFDCDSSNGTCALANDLYLRLWNWSYKNGRNLPENLSNQFGHVWERFGSDAMNSFQTTYSTAVKLYGNEGSTYKNTLLQKFAGLTHSIGNFTLVPFKLLHDDKKSFNQYRGANFGKYFVYDYFDLSLKLIKENVDNATFERYIDTFYLNDYVDENYNILPLISRHELFLAQEKIDLTDPEKFLPLDIDELNEYIQNVIEKIISRGNRIMKEIKKDDRVGIATQQVVPVKQQPIKERKMVNGWLICFLTCIVISGVSLYIFIMSEIFGYISFADAVKNYGILPVLQALAEEFPLIEYILASIFGGGVLVAAMMLIRLCAVKFANRFLRRCDDCKKLFALRRIRTVIDSQENISILVELKRKDLEGHIDGTQEQYIPGTRTTYRYIFQCKHCGRKYSRYKTIDRKNI